MEKKFINNLTLFLFVIIFGIITYQNSLVLEYSLLQIRMLDDLALLNSFVRFKNFVYERNLQYTFGFIDYSYGNLFWILNTIFLTPLTLFNNDAIVIFAARQMAAFFAFELSNGLKFDSWKGENSFINSFVSLIINFQKAI